ncbi:MAG: C39 family peptidase [Acidobacteriota bacterium]
MSPSPKPLSPKTSPTKPGFIQVLPQPDDTTCGPTCLHALYRFYGVDYPLERIIREVHRFEHGGTVAVALANHALERGFEAIIYTYNLQVFDPTWFQEPAVDLKTRLARQAEVKNRKRLSQVTQLYLRYLELGGALRFAPLGRRLLNFYLDRGVPVLTGLSATYLYNCAREHDNEADDIRGEPVGHFVVLSGMDTSGEQVLVADPLHLNPLNPGRRHYAVDLERLLIAIPLGVLTYDANLLILRPAGSAAEDPPCGAP